MIIKALAYLALAITLIAPCLYLAGSLAQGGLNIALVLGAVLWFAAAPFAFKTSEDGDA